MLLHFYKFSYLKTKKKKMSDTIYLFRVLFTKFIFSCFKTVLKHLVLCWFGFGVVGVRFG